MALANVAVLFAQQKKKVLVIDFDLEAPGLHRFFLNPNTPFKKKRSSSPQVKKGTIDLFTELQMQIKKQYPTKQKYNSDKSGTRRKLSRIIGKLLDSGDYTNEIRLKNPNSDKENVTLDFIAAGLFNENYPKNVYNLDWQDFHKKYSEIFPIFIEELCKRYHYIFIDSRTGITDIGSICTMLLPEKLVLVFTSNEQSLHGAIEIGRQTVEDRQESNDLRPLPLFPLIARIEDAEDELKRKWIDDAQRRFEEVFIEVYSLDECDLTAYFNMVRIPHRSFYSYGELIAAEREEEKETGSLTSAFSQFIRCLDFDNPHEASNLLAMEEKKKTNELFEKLDDEKFLKQQIIDNPNDSLLYEHYTNYLFRYSRYSEAIVICDKMIKRFGDAEEPTLRELVARALWDKGYSLQVLNKNNEAIAVYDEVVKRFGDAEEPALREQVAMALYNKGYSLGVLNKNNEAIAVCDEVVKRFGDAEELALREQVARALWNKGYSLQVLNKNNEAIAVYDEVVKRFGDAEEPALRDVVAAALVDKGIKFLYQKKYEEANNCFIKVIEFSDIKTGITFKVNKVVALSGLGRIDTALKLLKQLTKKYTIDPKLTKDFIKDLEMLATAPKPPKGINKILEQARIILKV